MKLLSTFLVMLLFAISDAGPMAYSACQATAASVCAAGCVASIDRGVPRVLCGVLRLGASHLCSH